MNRFLLLVILTLSVAAPVSAQRSSTPISARTMPSPIPCRQRSFSIPFEVHPDGSADPAKEIELMVSRDRGVQWHAAGRQPVDAGKFDYKAEDDGEFWFAFRTITLSGMTKQTGGGGPALRVLVDATSPVLNLDVKQQESGEILVQWKAEDRNLQGRRPDFAVAFKDISPTENDWTPLNVDGKHFRETEKGMDGRFLFWPENDVTTLKFRAVASDVVGNRSEKVLSIEIKPVHWDEETRIRDALKAGEEKPIAPDGRVETVAQNETTSKPAVSRAKTGAVPLQPPKPVRMRKQREATNTANTGAVPVENGRFPEKPVLPSEPKATTEEATTEETVVGDPLTVRLIADMNRFFDGTLTVDSVAGKAEKPSASVEDGPVLPASPPVVTGGAAAAPAIVPASAAAPVANSSGFPPPAGPLRPEGAGIPADESMPVLRNPGRITGISLNTASRQPQVIVKWQVGDIPWHDAQVDVMKSSDVRGPWFPVATNLPNNGEYWWFLSVEDFKPFFVMIQVRSPRGGVHLDTTKSAIRINPKAAGR